MINILPIMLDLPQTDATLKSGNLTKTEDRHEIVLSSLVSKVEFFNSEILVSGEISGKTRFLNIKDGTEAQASVTGGTFSFSKVPSTKQEVGRHDITTDGDLMVVHEIDSEKNAEHSVPMAFFLALGR